MFSVFLQFNPYCVRAGNSHAAVRPGSCIYRAISVKLLGWLRCVNTFCSPSEISSCLSRCYWTEFQEFGVLYSGWIVLLNIHVPVSLETLTHRSDCASYECSAFANSLRYTFPFSIVLIFASFHPLSCKSNFQMAKITCKYISIYCLTHSCWQYQVKCDARSEEHTSNNCSDMKSASTESCC